jgi:hypothetical protein
MARQIKLNGREQSMMRTIGFGLGITGTEVQERMAMLPDELVDVLNSLMEVGYLETASMKERVTLANYATESFEINPSYASDLKEALKRH